MPKFKDYYAVLGVQPRSHARIIEETYWEQAHELHEELHDEPTKKLQKKLNQINEAYEMLGSPHKRAAYDRKRFDAAGLDRRTGAAVVLRSRSSWSSASPSVPTSRSRLEVEYKEGARGGRLLPCVEAVRRQLALLDLVATCLRS